LEIKVDLISGGKTGPKTHCKGDSHSSKTANIILPGLVINKGERPYVCKRNIVPVWAIQLGRDELFQFNQHNAQFNEFEYHFACRRKVVHLCFITSPGKMIFADLEL